MSVTPGPTDGVQTVMVPVAIEMLRYLSRDWSEPVRIRIETDDDGRHTMVLRTTAEPRRKEPSS
jgi:hypothetical protein